MAVNIIGAGLAGLTAAITLSQQKIAVNLVSALPSERSQSVLAEGGINGALNVMGEDDTPAEHMADTLKAGGSIADEAAARNLTEHAPQILEWLMSLGVPFHMEDGHVMQRNFGGQKKKRTAFAKSSTGKAIVTALIDEVRKYEAAGLVRRYDHHVFGKLLLSDASAPAAGRRCTGVLVRDDYTGQVLSLNGPVILSFGGLNGFFPGMTTGTVTNSGDAAARVFSQGVTFSNLEMIQYHPTTIGIAGKQCLVSEAARGEGGRLFLMRGGKPWFFMEEKYPELGNLMPRDVVSREMFLAVREARREMGDEAITDAGAQMGPPTKKRRKQKMQKDSYAGLRPAQVYLEMRHLDRKVWEKKLSDLREELIHYRNIDPACEPVPVEPGIHYFMGGIDVDIDHRTNIEGLYAAGECCSQYHGANRLGGNSTLGAIYGGMTAARTAAMELSSADLSDASPSEDQPQNFTQEKAAECFRASDPLHAAHLRDILLDALGIIRDHDGIAAALDEVHAMMLSDALNMCERERLLLAEAMLRSADIRKESRGAHCRSDYPDQDEAFNRLTKAQMDPAGGIVKVNI